MPVLGSIRSDHKRFKDIVRGRIRQDLRRFVSQGELIGRRGKDLLSIPIPRIDIPRFQFGPADEGVGQGEGEAGAGVGEAGDQAAPHLLEVDVDLDEVLKILAEELELPRIEPRGHKNVLAPTRRYRSMRKVGPQSLRHHRRTHMEALKRHIASGNYDPKNPRIIPIKEDMRYRSWQDDPRPMRNAVVLYMMDVSGSMGDAQKHVVRSTAFWIDAWLAANYQGVETRYIIHDAKAREVDRDTFFHTRENGGTLISSAYKLACRILDRDYPAEDWNLYPFHFSDGDNWSGDDSSVCVELLAKELIPRCNQFSYGQVESAYGSGRFLKVLTEAFDTEPRVAATPIESADAIVDALKVFLGKGQ